MRFSIDKNLLDKILEYLSKQPFREVVNLIITAQQDAKPIEEDNNDSKGN